MCINPLPSSSSDFRIFLFTLVRSLIPFTVKHIASPTLVKLYFSSCPYRFIFVKCYLGMESSDMSGFGGHFISFVELLKRFNYIDMPDCIYSSPIHFLVLFSPSFQFFCSFSFFLPRSYLSVKVKSTEDYSFPNRVQNLVSMSNCYFPRNSSLTFWVTINTSDCLCIDRDLMGVGKNKFSLIFTFWFKG